MSMLKRYIFFCVCLVGVLPIQAMENPPRSEEALTVPSTQRGSSNNGRAIKASAENTCQNSAIPFEMIEILPYNPENTEDVPQNINSAYQDCFGEGRLFRIVPERERQDQGKWHAEAVKKMQGFGEALNHLGVSQNPLIASFHFDFGAGHQARITLPRIFFSGIDADLKKSIALEPINNYLADLNDLKLERFRFVLRPLLKERSLEGMVNSSFENKGDNVQFFYKKFSVSQGYSVVFTQVEEQGCKSKKQNSQQQGQKAKSSTRKGGCEEQTSDTDMESDGGAAQSNAQSVLDFKEFVLSHFMSGSRKDFEEFYKPFEEYENLKGDNRHYQTNYHPRRNSKTLQENLGILDKESKIAAMQMYLKQKKGAFLKTVFGQEEDFDFFSCNGKKDQGKQGMAYCFHQSEQAFLRYILEKEDTYIQSHFSKSLVEGIRSYIMTNIEALLESNVINVASSQAEIDEDIVAKESVLPSAAELKKNTSSSNKQKTRKGSKGDSSVVLTLDAPRITLDLISQRHVCVFCRGTIAVRYKDLLNKVQSTISSISISNKNTQKKQEKKEIQEFIEKLNKKIGNSELRLKPDSVVGCEIRNISDSQRLRVRACSYQDLNNAHLMGKIATKEVSYEDF